jgi:hypothetical protein
LFHSAIGGDPLNRRHIADRQGEYGFGCGERDLHSTDGTECAAESFFATLNSELVYHRAYRSHAEASPDVFYYIEAWYNRRRLHSTLGYESPEVYEQLYHNNAIRA